MLLSCRRLIPPFRNDMPQLPLPQLGATSPTTVVPVVQTQQIRALAGPAAPVGDELQLGGPAPSTAPQAFAGCGSKRRAPLFRPFGRAWGAGGVWMRPHRGAIHGHDRPGDVASCVRPPLELLQHAVPDPLLGSSGESGNRPSSRGRSAPADGLFPPRHARAGPPQDAVHDLAMGTGRPRSCGGSGSKQLLINLPVP